MPILIHFCKVDLEPARLNSIANEGSQHGPGFDCSQGDYFQEEGPQKWIAMSSYTAVILGDNLWWPETHKLVHLTKDSNKLHSFPKARHRSLLDQVKAPE